MAKYEKWLGAGLGLLLTGPVGGLFGFLAGSLVEQSTANKKHTPAGISEFEVNVIVLASHLIKIDGKIALEEISFLKNFLSMHFDPQFDANRQQIINQCLQKDYDLNVACGQIRMYAGMNTKLQIVHFLFDLATCDSELDERENFFIFKVAGFLNVNDVEFRRIKSEHRPQPGTDRYIYSLLGVKSTMTLEEIRSIYRQLVLKYHPDRNTGATAEERRQLAQKFQQIKEAYQQIKLLKGDGA